MCPKTLGFAFYRSELRYVSSDRSRIAIAHDRGKSSAKLFLESSSPLSALPSDALNRYATQIVQQSEVVQNAFRILPPMKRPEVFRDPKRFEEHVLFVHYGRSHETFF